MTPQETLLNQAPRLVQWGIARGLIRMPNKTSNRDDAAKANDRERYLARREKYLAAGLTTGGTQPKGWGATKPAA